MFEVDVIAALAGTGLANLQGVVHASVDCIEVKRRRKKAFRVGHFATSSFKKIIQINLKLASQTFDANIPGNNDVDDVVTIV